MDPAVAEVSRSLAQLVQSGRLARAGADRVTRELQLQLKRTDELTNALVAVLDAVVVAVERRDIAVRHRDGYYFVHLETLRQGVEELAGYAAAPLREALLMASLAQPDAGILSMGTRAQFEGLPRRRYTVVELAAARAFLLRRAPPGLMGSLEQ